MSKTTVHVLCMHGMVTHSSHMLHPHSIDLFHHCIGKCIGARSAPGHFPPQCWLHIYSKLRNIFPLKKIYIFSRVVTYSKLKVELPLDIWSFLVSLRNYCRGEWVKIAMPREHIRAVCLNISITLLSPKLQQQFVIVTLRHHDNRGWTPRMIRPVKYQIHQRYYMYNITDGSDIPPIGSFVEPSPALICRYKG